MEDGSGSHQSFIPEGGADESWDALAQLACKVNRSSKKKGSPSSRSPIQLIRGSSSVSDSLGSDPSVLSVAKVAGPIISDSELMYRTGLSINCR